jgi:hypothetical protein
MEVTGHLQEWKRTEEETPQLEQERLLQQVKADNQEMGSIEKRYAHTCSPGVNCTSAPVHNIFTINAGHMTLRSQENYAHIKCTLFTSVFTLNTFRVANNG